MGHAITAPTHLPQSGFARLCQAALYLGRALSYARELQTMDATRVAAIRTLADELGDFCAVTDDDATAAVPADDRRNAGLALLGPRCVARSALFVALEAFTCPEKMNPDAGYSMCSTARTYDELGLQVFSTQALKLASEQLHGLAMEIVASMSGAGADAGVLPLGMVSPFVLDAMYCSAVTFHWLFGESGIEAYKTPIKDLETFMAMVGGQWRLAISYCEISKLYEVEKRVRGNMVV
jgi:hypothetical protein